MNVIRTIGEVLRDFCTVNREIITAICKAARSFLNAARAFRQRERRQGISSPAYYVQVSGETGEVYLTNTAAFRAVDRLHGAKRDNAMIYDENGWCLYR